MRKLTRIDRLFLCGLLFASCGPETLEPAAPAPASGIFDAPAGQPSALPSLNGEVRKVLVHKVLDGGRHLFLDAQEMTGERYWIATAPGDFAAGGTYAFSKGLFKTGYRSEELDQTFDNLYLVSDLRPTGAAPSAHGGAAAGPPTADSGAAIPEKVTRVAGSMAIAEVLDRAAELAGQRVQVTGRVTKVNPEIMDRNWIHLQDGSRDDVDFVVTSTTVQVPVGHTVTLAGTLGIDVDFGAGYRYDVILENAEFAQ